MKKLIPPSRSYKYFVGIDIGYKFHVGAFIYQSDFLSANEKWKRAETIRIDSDSKGLRKLLNKLGQLSTHADEVLIFLEPTGGHYGYVLVNVLIDAGYKVYQVDNKAVKDFKELNLGIYEKTDDIDAKILAYMGFHKDLHPSFVSVHLITSFSSELIIFRTLFRDRFTLKKQLTQRKNQFQQALAVTNPELKLVFSSLVCSSALALVLRYPTSIEMSKAPEREIRQVLVEEGFNTVASRLAKKIKEVLSCPIYTDSYHLVNRQTWLIHEIERLELAIEHIDQQIHNLLHGEEEKGLAGHPYTPILFSLPVMGDIWACTLIGVIGDIKRFKTFRCFKSYLGFSAENKKSGISVDFKRFKKRGVRDSRRVLFQMAFLLISPKSKPSVFSVYYHSLIKGRKDKDLPPMKKIKAIGHVCGKLAQVIYGCLKTGNLYDPIVHAKACGISLEEFKTKEAEPFIKEEWVHGFIDKKANGDEPRIEEMIKRDDTLIGDKLRLLLKKRNMSTGQLTRSTGLSRATMSRIMHGHVPAADTLNRIAVVLEVSPGYLRGGYTLPVHLVEEDVLTLADFRCVPYLRLIREIAEHGLTSEDIKKLIGILKKSPD